MKSPIKASLKTEILPIAIIFLSFGLSLVFYKKFPEQVATHWNFSGEPNGYSSKGFAAFFFPVLILAIYLILLLIPNIDPRKKQYKDFSVAYHAIKTAAVTFAFLLYIYIGLAALGFDLAINKVVPGAVGLFIMLIGLYLPKIKSNWFLGIRTPWTLSNEKVWEKTHQLGGKIFTVIGFIIFTGSFFALPAKMYFDIVIFLTVAAALIPFAYSYFIYRKEK